MWLARDKDNCLYLFLKKPERNEKGWWSAPKGDVIIGNYDYIEDITNISIRNRDFRIPSILFPELKWENEPVEIEILPKPTQETLVSNPIYKAIYDVGFNDCKLEFEKPDTYSKQDKIKLIDDIVDYIKRFGLRDGVVSDIYESLFADIMEK